MGVRRRVGRVGDNFERSLALPNNVSLVRLPPTATTSYLYPTYYLFPLL